MPTDNGDFSALDHFDPAKLRLNQNFAEGAGVKKLLTTVNVAKPSKQDFVRVHPSEVYRMPAALLELKDDRECYLLKPEVWGELAGEWYSCMLFTYINRQGTIRLWPVRLPDASGKHNSWHQSALEAAEHAIPRWVRITANMDNKCYDISVATANIPDAVWPEQTFQELLMIAFRGKLIDRVDHPVVLKLRGEA
jgi:hypothetical protein